MWILVLIIAGGGVSDGARPNDDVQVPGFSLKASCEVSGREAVADLKAWGKDAKFVCVRGPWRVGG